MSTSKGGRRSPDLGMDAVDRIHREMQIDEPWTLREERGFTWWGAWIRERVWTGDAVRSRGETLWHVRAVTPTFRDLPDEPATYAAVIDMNLLQPMSAFVFDPDDGTVSARCGVFVYGAVAPWLSTWLLTAVGLQASMAWLAAGSDAAAGLVRDDLPHPQAGPRRDPDDMLNVAMGLPAMPSPVTVAVLEAAAAELAAEGVTASFDPETDSLLAACPMGPDQAAMWGVRSAEHPFLGPGAVTRLGLPEVVGPRRGAWLANALNAAESADWRGEDRPHALGAWKFDGRQLYHDTFLPGVLLGRLDLDDAILLARNLLAWGMVRARFAGERLPWLETAATAKYPGDEPVEEESGSGDGSATGTGEGEEPFVPFAERSFGPAARTPRTRQADPASGQPRGVREPRELVVDPADAAAFHEIDDAVAEAEDGDRIVVRPGTYRKPVVVDRAVAIVGDGDIGAIVLEPVGGECLGFAVSGASAEGLTIRPSRAGNDGEVWSAVAVHDVEATVEGCRLSARLGATVWVGGPSSCAVILGCSITDGAQNAVFVTEEGNAELAACRIAGNRWPCTANGPHATLRLEKCDVVDNLDGGLATIDRALLVVERTTVARNAGVGVLLGDAAPASRVEDCVVEGNLEVGVMVGGGRGGSILRNKVRDNGVGIGVVGGASPRVEGNELDGNGVGIGVRGRGSDPVVVANSVAGARESGVIVDEAAAGRFQKNTVSGAGASGIWVDNAGTRPTFAGNQVSGCAQAGVLVTGGAGGAFSSNDLRGNGAGSWKLDRPGELVRTGNLEDTGPAAGTPDAWPGGTPGRVN